MGLFVALTFGSAYPAGKHIVSTVDPVLFACARYLLAGTVMLTLLALRGQSIAVSRADLWRLAGLGFLGYALFQGTWAVALTMTTPAKAVVLVATTPIFGAMFGLLAGERLSAAGWIGVLLAFLGVFVIVNDSYSSFNLAGGSVLGDALFVFVAAVWAVYGALSRPCVLRLGVWRTSGWCALLGSGLLLPLALPGAIAQDWQRVDATTVLAFAHTSLVVGCFGLAAWGGGLARLGLTRIATYLYLSPVVGITLSGLLLGQWLSQVQMSGAAMVLLGIAMTQMLGRRH